jgi:hypothetical protein
MDKVKEQASIVSQLLFSAETSAIYAKTLARTWDILREVGVLLWLVLCLTLVGGEWFYRTAVNLGRSTRVWYTSLSEKSIDAEAQSMTTTGQALLDVVQSGTGKLLSQARQQLGIAEPAPKPVASAPTAPQPPSPPPFTPSPAAPPIPPPLPVASADDEADLA